MANCPQCGRLLEAHAEVGRHEGLKVGDVGMCIGCGTPLILDALPYEFRKMTPDEFSNLDSHTKLLLERAKKEISQNKKEASTRGLESARKSELER